MDKRISMEKIENDASYAYVSQLLFNAEVMTMNLGRVFTQEEARNYFACILAYNTAHEKSGTYCVFEENGNFIGMGSLVADGDTAEVEYMVLPAFWNQGYATAMVKKLLEMARQHPEIRKVSGITDPGNRPSIKVLMKNGFVFEGKMHVEEDDTAADIYSILL